MQYGFVGLAAAALVLGMREHPWALGLGLASLGSALVHLVGMLVATSTLVALVPQAPGRGATALAHGLDVAWVVHVVGASLWFGLASLCLSAWRGEPGPCRSV